VAGVALAGVALAWLWRGRPGVAGHTHWRASSGRQAWPEVSIPTPDKKVSLASGRAVKVDQVDGARVYTLELDVADALILR